MAYWALLGPIGTNWGPIGTNWAPIGPNWVPIGPNWDPVGPHWVPIGPNWAPLGPIGPYWALLGPGPGCWEVASSQVTRIAIRSAFLELATGATEVVSRTAARTPIPHAPGARMTAVTQTPSNPLTPLRGHQACEMCLSPSCCPPPGAAKPSSQAPPAKV